MRFKYCASKYYYVMVFGQQEMRKRTLFLFAPSLKYSKREKSKRQKKKNLKFIANAILYRRHGHNVDWIVQQHSSVCAQMFLS